MKRFKIWFWLIIVLILGGFALIMIGLHYSVEKAAVKKEIVKIKPVVKKKKNIQTKKLLCHPVKVVAYQIGREFIDKIFADKIPYANSDYVSGKLDVASWCARTGKLLQVARFRDLYALEISAAVSFSGVDEKLLSALVAIESGGNKNARNPNSTATGLGQLLNGTARDLGVIDAYDPQQNLNGTAKFLRQLLDIFNNDVDKALLGYYYGPQGAKNAMARGLNPTDEEYVQKINYIRAHI